MNTEIGKLGNQIEKMQCEIEEGTKSKLSLEQEKVSLEMRMAEVEEQKEGISHKYEVDSHPNSLILDFAIYASIILDNVI